MMLTTGALVAQANSGQDWVTPGQWQAATGGVKSGNVGVTSASEGAVDYWVVWEEFTVGGQKYTQKIYRVRKDDPSLEPGETQRLSDAEKNGTGVEVEVDGSNKVNSVTGLP